MDPKHGYFPQKHHSIDHEKPIRLSIITNCVMKNSIPQHPLWVRRKVNANWNKDKNLPMEGRSPNTKRLKQIKKSRAVWITAKYPGIKIKNLSRNFWDKTNQNRTYQVFQLQTLWLPKTNSLAEALVEGKKTAVKTVHKKKDTGR